MGNFFGLHLDFHLFSPTPKDWFFFFRHQKIFVGRKKNIGDDDGGLGHIIIPSEKRKAGDFVVGFWVALGWWAPWISSMPNLGKEHGSHLGKHVETWVEGKHRQSSGEFTGYAWRVHKGSNQQIHHFCWCIFLEEGNPRFYLYNFHKRTLGRGLKKLHRSLQCVSAAQNS